MHESFEVDHPEKFLPWFVWGNPLCELVIRIHRTGFTCWKSRFPERETRRQSIPYDSIVNRGNIAGTILIYEIIRE